MLSRIDLTFWDGSNLLLKASDAGETITGSNLRDTTRGFAGDDILDTGGHPGGKQYLKGKQGNNTYHNGTEAGHVPLSSHIEYDGWETDKVIFKNLPLSDFTFSTF
ncbi:hypothetical protein [Pseudovibrio sp. SCP19]|uniref:hypothetical protein n=1 Tax=Pseudovibrio sp. SCP19 TaxID=3141374 RepID=UPI00333D7A8C